MQYLSTRALHVDRTASSCCYRDMSALLDPFFPSARSPVLVDEYPARANQNGLGWEEPCRTCSSIFKLSSQQDRTSPIPESERFSGKPAQPFVGSVPAARQPHHLPETNPSSQQRPLRRHYSARSCTCHSRSKVGPSTAVRLCSTPGGRRRGGMVCGQVGPRA